MHATGVLDAFRAVAVAEPDSIAIDDNGRELTYRQLAELADATADRIGPAPGVVAVAATHEAATVVAMLGIWSAGGAYCPIDPSFPSQRRRAMLATAGCRLALTPLEPAELPPAELRSVAQSSDGNEPIGLAYTLFTSGSTGDPKPVLTPQAALTAVVASLRELFAVTPADRVLQFASLNWDTSMEEILPALTSGARLVFDADAHRGSFPHFLRAVRRHAITVLDLPTAYWHALVHYLAESSVALPPSVRLVIIGGEAASPARLADWRALSTDHARLLNTYGSTETTLITHAIDLHGPLAAGHGAGNRVPIGRPLPHVRELITDEDELLVGGPALALGYRGRPDETAQRFVGRDGERYFRTGDRVERATDGVLLHAGRLDAVLKIRGVRVDPAEVEAHIAEHPAVGAVAVTGVRVADHTILAAYVVARSSASAHGLDASIIEHLRGRVPAHLIPSRVRVVADLVYTASGKVDRHRIKEALA